MRRALIVLVALVVVAGGAAAFYAVRTVPVKYADPVEHFKYGSFGTEADSMPMAIWEALPDVCPDRLPGGWAALGLIYEPGHARPVGVSESRVGGIDRMGVNCAMCHAGAVRERPDAPALVIAGMPNQQLDFEGYVQFILDCVGDARFTPDTVVAAMRKHGDVSAVEAAFYRTFVVSKVKTLTAAKQPQFAWFASKPPAGPGRLDTPNSLKRMLGVEITADSVGTVDFPAVWNQSARRNRFVHWDANSPSLTERDHITAAIAGATAASLDHPELARIENWLDGLPPPKYPFAIDQALAARGSGLYTEHCALCHEQRPLDVTPIALLATDRSRLDALSAPLVEKMNAFGSSSGGAAHYRKTGGYSNVLMDAVWARAPYLHNGSVPTMMDLLTPGDRRPAVFYSGSSLYDPARMGFISDGAGKERGRFRFDTTQPGNGNRGHEYGTTLPDDDKRALVEYLKTR